MALATTWKRQSESEEGSRRSSGKINVCGRLKNFMVFLLRFPQRLIFLFLFVDTSMLTSE